MTSIYFGGARVKSSSATTKGGKSVIKIELETADHYELASLLRQLDEIDAEQKVAANPKPKSKKAAPLLALPAPLKQLTFRDGADE